MACGGRRRAHGVGEELGRAAASRRKRRSRGSCTREGEEGGARYHAGDVLCASGFMATAGGVRGGASRGAAAAVITRWGGAVGGVRGRAAGGGVGVRDLEIWGIWGFRGARSYLA